jgi:hypothetical protein
VDGGARGNPATYAELAEFNLSIALNEADAVFSQRAA